MKLEMLFFRGISKDSLLSSLNKMVGYGGLMQASLISFLPVSGEFLPVQIYGYATKGLPGLEIVGPAQIARGLKQKLIFFTKKENVKTQPLRYVICLEMDTKRVKDDDIFRWIELPSLVLYWTLAQILPITEMDRCLCLGKINFNGVLEVPIIPEEVLESARMEGSRVTFVCQDQQGGGLHIPIESLIEPCEFLKKIKKVKLREL